jgi:hypothetical protein
MENKDPVEYVLTGIAELLTKHDVKAGGESECEPFRVQSDNQKRGNKTS